MPPFHSGRAGISVASSAFLFVIILTCAALAGEKNITPKPDGTAKPKERVKSEGLTDIPITTGYDAKGLVLPDFDRQGRKRGRLEAGVTRRLDEERVEFKGVKFITYNPETEQPDLEILMTTSVFNLKTQVLTSSDRATVKRADFEIIGDTAEFGMLSRIGTLEGNVKMVVHGKMQNRENAGE
jgi:hypothetical protein